MRYFFTIDNDNVQFIGASVNDSATLITQSTYPAKEYREGYEARLAYDEEQGIYWEYYIPETPYDELADMREALNTLGVE